MESLHGGLLAVQEDGSMHFGRSGPAARLAIDTLTSALLDDPMTQHWSRRSDAARRAFCDIYIRGSLSDGEPRLNLLSKGGGGAVVAILLPQQKPGWLASTLQGLRLLLAAVPVAKWREFAAFDEYLSLRKQSLQQEHGPFIHILALGTRPEAQGKGFGSQLLRRVLAHADKHLLPVYLEASTERSRQLYLRHGFRNLETWHGGFPLFLMWRPASGNPAADAGIGPAAGAEASSATAGLPAASASAAGAGCPAAAAAGNVPAPEAGTAAGPPP